MVPGQLVIHRGKKLISNSHFIHKMGSKRIIVNFKIFRTKYSHYFYNLRLGNDTIVKKERKSGDKFDFKTLVTKDTRRQSLKARNILRD